MTEHPSHFARAYGIYPCAGGFAYAVVEMRGLLIDWGKIDLGEDSDEEFELRLRDECARCSPCAIAVEACADTKRAEKARRRVTVVVAMAEELGLLAVPVRSDAVRRHLGLEVTATKHDVAEELCRLFPELAHRMPTRSIWKRDRRIHVFMALALARTLLMDAASGHGIEDPIIAV